MTERMRGKLTVLAPKDKDKNRIVLITAVGEVVAEIGKGKRDYDKELATARHIVSLWNAEERRIDQADRAEALLIADEEPCPECKTSTLRAKSLNEGGGVVCRNKDCGYWFCY